MPTSVPGEEIVILEIGCGLNPHSLRMKNGKMMSGEWKMPVFDNNIGTVRINPNDVRNEEKTIHLSTDSKKYFDISKKYYDFNYDLRPKNLSKDHSMDIDFLNYTLNFYFKKNFLFKYCIILRPTNPLRKISTLNNSYKLFRKSI